MKNIKVSVLVPIYGVEKYIERSARSLFEQTYENLEIIFVNDATKDRSMEILYDTLKDYPRRTEQTRIVEHEVNKGLAMARKTGISYATGEFVFHLDSDDYLEPHSIETLVGCIDSEDVDIVTGSYKKLLPKHSIVVSQSHLNGLSPQEVSIQMISRRTIFNIWNRLFRRSLYDNLEIPVINFGEDYVTTPRMFRRARAVRFIDKVTYDYNQISTGVFKNTAKLSHRQDLGHAADFLTDFYSSDPDCLEAINLGRLVGLASIILQCRNRSVLRSISVPEYLRPLMNDPRLGNSRYVLWLYKHKFYGLLVLSGHLYLALR